MNRSFVLPLTALVIGAFSSTSSVACSSDGGSDTSSGTGAAAGAAGSTSGTGGSSNGGATTGGNGGAATGGSGGTSSGGAGGATTGGNGGTSGAGGEGGSTGGSGGAAGTTGGSAGGTGGTGGAAPLHDIVETAKADPDLSTLVDLMTAAGLATTLKGEGPFTVFAPHDTAFAAFFKATGLSADDLKKPANAEVLKDVLGYHVSTDASQATPPTVGLYGAELLSLFDIGTVLGATQKTAFLDDSTDMAGAAIRVGLGFPLPFSGTVSTRDVAATNGVLQIVDAVLVPPRYASYTTTIAFDPTGAKSSVLDLLTYASTVGFDDGMGGTAKELTTFVALATKCGVVPPLASATDITIFAPTDAAFEKAMIDPAKADCAKVLPVLQYHVATSIAPYSAAVALAASGGNVSTLSGGKIKFKIDTAKGLLVDDGSAGPPGFVFKNLQAANGVLHTIDGVLTPK